MRFQCILTQKIRAEIWGGYHVFFQQTKRLNSCDKDKTQLSLNHTARQTLCQKGEKTDQVLFPVFFAFQDT